MFESFSRNMKKKPSAFKEAINEIIGASTKVVSSAASPPREAPPAPICMADHTLPLNLPNKLCGVSSIYYLNMERSVERKRHIESILCDMEGEGGGGGAADQKIPKVRIEAVDGNSPNFSVERYFSFYGGSSKNPRMMSTEYATTLSHIMAIQQFVEDSYSAPWGSDDNAIGLVVEDDLSSEFMPYWRVNIETMVRLRAPRDWEILQLSYILFDYTPIDEFEHWMMHKNMCGTAAYLIRLGAAKRLIEYLTKYSNPTEFRFCIGSEHPYYHHADRFLYSFFKTYGVNPPLFTYRDSNDSFIHPDHVDFHAGSKEKTKKLWLGWEV